MHPLQLDYLIVEHRLPPALAERVRRAPPGDQESTLNEIVDIHNRMRKQQQQQQLVAEQADGFPPLTGVTSGSR